MERWKVTPNAVPGGRSSVYNQMEPRPGIPNGAMQDIVNGHMLVCVAKDSKYVKEMAHKPSLLNEWQG